MSKKTKDVEKQNQKQLNALMDAWQAQIATKPMIVFKDNGKKYKTERYFCTDGFFPGYFGAKRKVLFIGREPRCTSEASYVERVMNGYFADGGCNGISWWRRLLYIAYGIQKEGAVKFDDVPVADDIVQEMSCGGGFNFAVMNISKYSNDSYDGATMDAALVARFLKDSELDKRNFFQEELELLAPDIIVTANLWEARIEEKYLNLCLPNDNFSDNLAPKSKEYDGIICRYKYKMAGREVDVVDLYHLSARNLPDEKGFYRPVMDVLFPNK